MSKRPRSLLYARNEQPPPLSIGLLAFQHAALSVVFLFYAVVIAKGAGFTPDQQQSLLVGTLLASGIGAILQAGSQRFSSGLLVIPLAAPIAMVLAIESARDAGPGGIAALAILGGIVQIVVGRGVRYLRAYVPPEVCGVVVLMLGVSMVPPAFDRMLTGHAGSAQAFEIDHLSLIVSMLTMVSIVICSIWLKGKIRLFSMLIGCTVGYLAAAALGQFGYFGAMVAQASIFAMPQITLPSFDLKISLLLAFLILAVVSAIDDIGVIVSSDKLDDAAWSKPDIAQISRGVSSFGGINILSGLVGGSFLGFSFSNIGLAFATGVTSRVVGVVAGITMIAISFFPKILAVVTAMPEPVLGGILGYAASYFIISGTELALSRMMSPRRMLVVGLSIAAGVAVQVRPEIAANAPVSLAVILESPLIVASVLAIVLNAVMRLGIAQRAAITIDEGAGRHERIAEALDEWGETWGLNRVTIMQATTATNQLVEAVLDLKDGELVLEARHDDVNLDIRVLYRGSPMVFPDKAPSPEELMNDPDGVSRMAGWLVRHLADRATATVEGGRQCVTMRFQS